MPDLSGWFEAHHSILSIGVSAISAVLIVVQIYNLTRSIHGQTYQRIYELMIGIDRFFIDHPELKGYFYPDAEVRKEVTVERDKLFSAAEMLIDYFDNVYHQKGSMPPGTFEGFLAYMCSIYQHSGVLRQYLDLSGRKSWYPKEFLDHLEGRSSGKSSRGRSS
jgi:hypothetical protein